MAKEVGALVGSFAEGIDNRSLLYEKFSFPKVWGQPEKVNDASRWSVLRIVTRGSDLLKGDATRLRRQASGRNVRPDNAERWTRLAGLAEKLATVARTDPAVVSAATENAKRLLADLQRSFAGQVITFEATLGGRLLVNLAGGVVENAGISLDRCFGLPVLPGSAVKGIARSQALGEIKEAPQQDKAKLLLAAMMIFGYGANDIRRDGAFSWAAETPALARDMAARIGAADFKGLASFLPAYPTTSPTIVVDMVNPHYPEYYRGKRKKATDDEYPIPNYFPAVEAGSSFGFAVLLTRQPPNGELSPQVLLQHARSWIERAIVTKGAGAKTAAGYGWFMLGRPQAASPQVAATPAPAVALSPVDALITKWRNKLNTKDNFPVALPELVALSSDNDLRRAFDTLIPESERRRTRKTSPYWQAFTSGRHADAGKKILQRLGINLT